MNHFTFDDISVGQKIRFTASLSEQEMEQFRLITGDENPLHTDEAFARAKGQDGRVVYGMLTASLLSTVAGMYLPGERSLIHEVEVKFVKPLLLKDSSSLFVTATITETHELFRRITIKVAINNAKDEKVLRAVMKVGVTD